MTAEASTTLYVPSGACSSCPHRGSPCQEARQRVQDQRFEVGRHYQCEFYRSIQEPAPAMPRPWWRRLIIAGGSIR